MKINQKSFLVAFFLSAFFMALPLFLFGQEAAAEGKNEEKKVTKQERNYQDKILSFSKNIQKKEIQNTQKILKKQKEKEIQITKILKNKKQKQHFLSKKKAYKKHYGRKKGTKKTWWWLRPWLDLDWLMIGIFALLGIGLFIGLWFLLAFRTSLTLLQAILLAISFGFALVTLIHSFSEENGRPSLYEYFIRFGFLAWIGWTMILAGLIALFGGTPSLSLFFIIGAILGGISFLLSIIFNDSIFNTPWN
jgi:hypothetical protein